MLNLNYEQMLEFICKESGLSRSQVEDKIDEKVSRLSGLVSREGAAHIVSNELGLKITEVPSKLKIQDIIAGMRNVEVVGRVRQVYETREFNKEGRSGKVGNFLLGDDTGVIRVVLWNSQADNMNALNVGMPVKIKKAYSKDNNGRKEIHLNDKAEIELNTKDEVPEFSSANFQRIFTRKKISELQSNEDNVEILGTIVQVFEPRYYEVCGQCNKRLKVRDGNFECEAHGAVNPAYSYLVNFQIDDGTETIRVTCFKAQTQELLAKTDQEIGLLRNNPAELSSVRASLIGQQIKMSGRVNKNEKFERIEFVPNKVDINPDPNEEITRLNEDLKKAQYEEETIE